MITISFPRLFYLSVQLDRLKIKRLTILDKVLKFYEQALGINEKELAVLKTRFESIEAGCRLDHPITISLYGSGIIQVYRYDSIRVYENKNYIHPLRRR